MIRIYFKKATSEYWGKSSYIPKAGEILLATDTKEKRTGDGAHTWNELAPKDTENNEDKETN